MRDSFIAVRLVPGGGEASAAGAEAFELRSFEAERYAPWTGPISPSYPAGPWEVVRVWRALRGPWALFRLESGLSDPRWAVRLSTTAGDRLVVLFLGQEIDRVPGVGLVHRPGTGSGSTLKIYLGCTPWMKIGDAPDDEVAYPVPSLVSERVRPAFDALASALGDRAEAIERFVRERLERGELEPEALLEALGLPRTFPASHAAPPQTYVHRDSPIYINA